MSPEDVRIRRAVQADVLPVFRIESTTFTQPWPLSAFERFLDEAGFLVAVSEATDAVVGYVVADTMPNHGRDIGHVKDIAVHPDARGHGLGRLLLRRALATLATDGAAVVKLEVRPSNDTAIGLYRDVGFEMRRRIPRYYADGEDALVMVLDGEEWIAGGDVLP